MGGFTDVRHHAEVDSTNRVAADLVRDGAGTGVVVVADHQAAGRGRRGRTWEAPPGSSLLVSVVLGPPVGEDLVALGTVACALAAADAVSAVAGFEPGLKWPNDLVVGERKLAGVLAELVATPRGAAVVVGLGLNVRWPDGAPSGLEATAVTAEEASGRPVDDSSLLDAYLTSLADLVDELDGEGRVGVVDNYRRRCVTIGRAVRVELPGNTVMAGIAAGVDDACRLLVETENAGYGIDAGDVVHLR